MTSRRELLAGLGAFALTGVPHMAQAASTLSVGSKSVTSVSDGNLVLPGDFAFAELPQDELAPILAEYGISRDQVEPPCNVTLLQDDERTVLFDVGSGPGFMPSAGALVESLDSLGVAPEDVTHVIFTHAHPDHLWGLLDDFDDPVFTDASYMIGQAEWDYWTDPNTISSIGEARAAFAVGAARRLEAIADQVEMIRPGQEVLPGVAAVESFGHTPGHLSFELRDGGDALLIVGDAIVNHHVAFARPDWASGSDQDPELGAKTRVTLLDKLAQEQMPLLGFHLPSGGLGRVERKDNAYRFVTEDM